MKLEELQKTKSNSEIAKGLSDKQLWEFTQTPIGIGCPDNVIEFLKECSNEFSKRDIKLTAICK
jgi:hypothetical protein